MKALLLTVVAPGSRLAMAAGLWLLTGAALAQGAGGQAGIYTCVDAYGRRLTSDRPIMACLDREQRELNKSGTTKRVVGPTLTASERDAIAARESEAAQQRQRAQENIRRDQAILIRYPNRAAHDAGRREALSSTQVVVDAAHSRIAELKVERKGMDEEMEFYRKDPSRAPAQLRRRIETNEQSMQQQQRAIAAQQAERDRINAKFDEELARLQGLWQPKATAAPAKP